GLGVLKNVEGAGADSIAAQIDDHRSAVEDGVIGEVLTLPSDDGLVLPLVVGQTPAYLVHRPIADDVREGSEVLGGHPAPRAAGRRMVGGRVSARVEQVVVSRTTHRQPGGGRKLIVQSTQHLMHTAREVHVDVEGRVGTVV